MPEPFTPPASSPSPYYQRFAASIRQLCHSGIVAGGVLRCDTDHIIKEGAGETKRLMKWVRGIIQEHNLIESPRLVYDYFCSASRNILGEKSECL